MSAAKWQQVCLSLSVLIKYIANHYKIVISVSYQYTGPQLCNRTLIGESHSSRNFSVNKQL